MSNHLDNVIQLDDFHIREDGIFQHIVMAIFSNYEFCIGSHRTIYKLIVIRVSNNHSKMIEWLDKHCVGIIRNHIESQF